MLTHSPGTCRIHSLHDLKLTHLQKVTLKRTTAFAFHPTSNKSLVVAGDTQGVLGLWDIVSYYTLNVHVYACHTILWCIYWRRFMSCQLLCSLCLPFPLPSVPSSPLSAVIGFFWCLPVPASHPCCHWLCPAFFSCQHQLSPSLYQYWWYSQIYWLWERSAGSGELKTNECRYTSLLCSYYSIATILGVFNRVLISRPVLISFHAHTTVNSGFQAHALNRRGILWILTLTSTTG